jgi:probable rRNA maturation factor
MNDTKTKPAPEVELQLASEELRAPAPASVRDWACRAARAAGGADGAITVRVVTEDEMRDLNRYWRGRDYSTNVLSFPFAMPEGLPLDAIDPIIGDIAICAPVVERQAGEQGKSIQAHWTHMMVHGVLHLLGHDHEQAGEAEIMEALEIAVLAELGYDDPYREPDTGAQGR